MRFALVENEISALSTVTKIANLLFRGIVIFNLIFFGLSWSTWFAGSEHQIGFADKFFGRSDGFRIDSSG